MLQEPHDIRASIVAYIRIRAQFYRANIDGSVPNPHVNTPSDTHYLRLVATRYEDLAKEIERQADLLNGRLSAGLWSEDGPNFMDARREALAVAQEAPAAHAPVDGPDQDR